MKTKLTILLFIITCTFAYAQSSGKNSRNNKEVPDFDKGATNYNQNKKVKKKNTKYSYSNRFDKKIEEYEERMENNAKKYKKMAKEMKKPQYSDPTHFGHKKKPKKRPPGKKKFCKECGMYH